MQTVDDPGPLFLQQHLPAPRLHQHGRVPASQGPVTSRTRRDNHVLHRAVDWRPLGHLGRAGHRAVHAQSG